MGAFFQALWGLGKDQILDEILSSGYSLPMSVNKVILIGRLGQDPEMRNTQGGASVCNFSLATNENWRDKSGQKQERTEWHRVVVWGKLAELCTNYLNKGRQVYLEGRLQTRQWQDQQGATRYTTEIVANNLQFLGGQNAGASMGAPMESTSAAGPQAMDAGFGAPATPAGGPEPSFTEDDIPF